MEHLTYFRTLWETSHSEFPKLNREYSRQQKKVRERQLETFIHSIKGCFVEDELDSELTNEHPLFSHIKIFLQEGLDYSAEQLDIILSNEMINSTLQFIRQARQFDQDLGLEEIFQACRNVWIMNGLQHLLGQNISLTPSVFAYSMLYPYTDNFIDDSTVSELEKQAFAERFYKRLNNQCVDPANQIEVKIFELVGMIEKEWPRVSHPEVYDSLLAIHAAQTESTALLSQKNQLTNSEVFDICVNKGGCSVTADGYLILGKLTSEQEKFLYGYGAYLQILDDLQDVKEDRAQGLMTCFSEAASRSVIDEYANKTFWLGEKILKSVEKLSYTNKAVFFSLMQRSIELFILESVMSGGSLFSKKYVKAFKHYSPLQISYLNKRRELLAALPKLIIEKIEKIAISYADRVNSVW